nr:hypothetical protein [Archaeoglobus profundus]
MILRALEKEKMFFGLTGGEPTIYRYWRNILRLFTGYPRLNIITNASGIRLKSDDDAHLLLTSVKSYKVSIHGVGRGAVEVTRSRAQKGLQFLEKMFDTLNRLEESLERKTNHLSYDFVVNVAVLKENVDEIPLLIDRLATLQDEYGYLTRIDVFRPTLVGNMKKHKSSILDLTKFAELCKELKETYSELPLTFDANIAHTPALYCWEIEPDGYVYSDMHFARVGSWRKHRLAEIIQFAYRYGPQLIRQYKGKEFVEFPDFEPIYEKDVIYQFKPKSNELHFFSAEDALLIYYLRNNKTYVFKGLLSYLIHTFTSCPLSQAIKLIKPIKFEDVKPILEFLEREGVIEKTESRFLKDFKIVNESINVKLGEREVC